MATSATVATPYLGPKKSSSKVSEDLIVSPSQVENGGPCLGTITVVRRDGSDGDCLEMNAGALTVTFGRSLNCDIRITKEEVSRNHAVVSVDANTGVVTVEHLSKNADTLVNGSALALNDKVILKTGDVISIAGRHFRFTSAQDWLLASMATPQVKKDAPLQPKTVTPAERSRTPLGEKFVQRDAVPADQKVEPVGFANKSLPTPMRKAIEARRKSVDAPQEPAPPAQETLSLEMQENVPALSVDVMKKSLPTPLKRDIQAKAKQNTGDLEPPKKLPSALKKELEAKTQRTNVVLEKRPTLPTPVKKAIQEKLTVSARSAEAPARSLPTPLKKAILSVGTSALRKKDPEPEQSETVLPEETVPSAGEHILSTVTKESAREVTDDVASTTPSAPVSQMPLLSQSLPTSLKKQIQSKRRPSAVGFCTPCDDTPRDLKEASEHPEYHTPVAQPNQAETSTDVPTSRIALPTPIRKDIHARRRESTNASDVRESTFSSSVQVTRVQTALIDESLPICGLPSAVLDTIRSRANLAPEKPAPTVPTPSRCGSAKLARYLRKKAIASTSKLHPRLASSVAVHIQKSARKAIREANANKARLNVGPALMHLADECPSPQAPRAPIATPLSRRVSFGSSKIKCFDKEKETVDVQSQDITVTRILFDEREQPGSVDSIDTTAAEVIETPSQPVQTISPVKAKTAIGTPIRQQAVQVEQAKAFSVPTSTISQKIATPLKKELISASQKILSARPATDAQKLRTPIRKELAAKSVEMGRSIAEKKQCSQLPADLSREIRTKAPAVSATIEARRSDLSSHHVPTPVKAELNQFAASVQQQLQQHRPVPVITSPLAKEVRRVGSSKAQESLVRQEELQSHKVGLPLKSELLVAAAKMHSDIVEKQVCLPETARLDKSELAKKAKEVSGSVHAKLEELQSHKLASPLRVDIPKASDAMANKIAAQSLTEARSLVTVAEGLKNELREKAASVISDLESKRPLPAISTSMASDIINKARILQASQSNSISKLEDSLQTKMSNCSHTPDQPAELQTTQESSVAPQETTAKKTKRVRIVVEEPVEDQAPSSKKRARKTKAAEKGESTTPTQGEESASAAVAPQPDEGEPATVKPRPSRGKKATAEPDAEVVVSDVVVAEEPAKGKRARRGKASGEKSEEPASAQEVAQQVQTSEASAGEELASVEAPKAPRRRSQKTAESAVPEVQATEPVVAKKTRKSADKEAELPEQTSEELTAAKRRSTRSKRSTVEDSTEAVIAAPEEAPAPKRRATRSAAAEQSVAAEEPAARRSTRARAARA